MNENTEMLTDNVNAEILADDFFDEDVQTVEQEPVTPTVAAEPEVWHTQENIAVSPVPDKPEEANVRTINDLDMLFDNLSSDVEGANKLISNIITKRKTVEEREQSIKDETAKLAKDRAEFDKYVVNTREALDLERKQTDEYVKVQKLRLQNEEAQFRADVEVKSSDLNLKEQALQIEQENLEKAKAQFSKYKATEEEKIQAEKEKIIAAQEALERDNRLSMETIINEKNAFAIEKEHFEKTRKIEEEKLAFEKDNLAQSCNRFKELVSQFNSEFEKLPEDNR